SANFGERGEIGSCERAHAVERHHDHAARPARRRGPAAGGIERTLVAPIERENRPAPIGKAALEIGRDAQRLAAENRRHARPGPTERPRARERPPSTRRRYGATPCTRNRFRLSRSRRRATVPSSAARPASLRSPKSAGGGRRARRDRRDRVWATTSVLVC